MLKNEVYKNHRERLVKILESLNADEATKRAGFFHNFPKRKLKKLLKSEEDKEVVSILKSFFKIKNILSFATFKKERKIQEWQKIFFDIKSENLRKMFFAIAKDVRPILILIADHLDKMRNLNSFSENIQKDLSIKTLEIFSPLCYSLGIGEIKGEIEDLAFKVLYLKEYQWLLENIKAAKEKREQYLQEITPKIKEILTNHNIYPLDIHSRAKHYFSLYLKLLRYDFQLDKIYDLIALRIIVQDIKDCYLTLGILHQYFKPLEGRIKDYIANPKPNGYRALHTTVYCFSDEIVEIQIKTLQMHQEAEAGIASHLAYKLETEKKDIYWYEKLKNWEKEINNLDKISESLNFDFFENRIFVLTPKGDVIDLPKGSTPVDFAYAIHSDIGDNCIGAKANGKIIPLNEELRTGQIVEILTQKGKGPSLDWLKFVKTRKAKNHIKRYFPNLSSSELKILEEKSVIKKGIEILKERIFKKTKKEGKNKIEVGGEIDIPTKIASCCSPKEGDEIIGFIIPGQEVSIHKKDCKNFQELSKKFPERVIKAKWIK